MTKLFLTGATGYLGQHIIQTAIQSGYSVRALYRSAPIQKDSLNSVEWVQGDIGDKESLQTHLAGCDAVIHSAGLVSIWRRDTNDFFAANVQGTENVFQAALKSGINRVVYTSSFFALGPTGETPADETHINRETPSPTPYANSKAQALPLASHYSQQGLNIITMIPALIYGPGKATQGNHITNMVKDYVNRKLPGIPGDGKKRWTFSYVEDVAQAHLLALEKGRAGEKYIVGGEDATLVEFLEILEDLTGIRRPRLELPIFLLKWVGGFEVARAKMSKHYLPKLTPDMLNVYKYHWRYSSQKAMKELGYTRTPLKAGLVRILEDIGFLKDERSTIL